jgi:hypothetical protein
MHKIFNSALEALEIIPHNTVLGFFVFADALEDFDFSTFFFGVAFLAADGFALVFLFALEAGFILHVQ